MSSFLWENNFSFFFFCFFFCCSLCCCFYARGLCQFRHVNNPSSVWIMILLTHFSGLTTTAVLSFMRSIARELDQTWSCLWGVTTLHGIPVLFVFFVLFFVLLIFSRGQTLQGGFVNLHTVFGCDESTYNPSSVQKLILLTQFSGITILQFLVTRETLQGG